MVNRTPHVRVQSYNPYKSRYPGPRVISREALDIVKTLRESGYAVAVDPDDGSKLHYSTEKGLREFLSDPIVLFVGGIPISVITGILSAWLYDRFKRIPSTEEVSIVVETDEHGARMRYDHKGAPISERRFQAILR